MKYETEEYIINYNECDKEYIKDFIKYFEIEKENIFDFFSIDKLDKKLIINLYDELEKYAEYRHHQLFETSVGNMDVDDNNYYIHMLSYKELIKRKGHTLDQLDYLYKIVVHEFVHICHENIEPIRKSLVWIREGIACLLSHQYDHREMELKNCTLEDLLNDNRVWYINYYSLMNFALINYGIDYVRQLIFNSEFGKEETSKIYNEFMNEKSIRNI